MRDLTTQSSRKADTRWPVVSESDARTALEWALRYAAVGWFVFPLDLREGRNKKPVVQWGEGSTNDPEQVRRYWRQFPGAPIGIACKRSGLVCIDNDNKPSQNKHGSEDFARLMGGDFGTRLIAKSPSGGEHLIYKADPTFEVRSRSNSLARGIDIKAGGGNYGGYFVATNGVDKRRWVNGGPDEVAPPAMPSRLRDLLLARENDGPKKRGSVSRSKLAEDTEGSPGDMPPITDERRVQPAGSEVDLAMLAWDALRVIPADDREVWRDMVFAVHAAFGGSVLGIRLVRDWSNTAKRVEVRDPDEAERIYRSADLPTDDGPAISATRLWATALLCGFEHADAPAVSFASVQLAADRYRHSLDIDVDARLQALVGRMFDDPPQPLSDPAGTTTPSSPDGRPIIVIRAGKLHEVTRKAEDALLQARDLEPVYQRGTELVRIVRLPDRQMLVPGAEVAAQVPIILPVEATWLRAQFERAAVFMGYDARSKKLVTKNCPPDVPMLFGQQQGEWRVPRLAAIVQAPTLRADGTVLQQAGYDAATGIVYDPCGVTFPAIPDAPTQADAQAAVQVLLEPVRQFPWVGDHDRAVWLAAVLTAFVRPSLPSAPMFLFGSPVRGSGKTKLATLVSVIPSGNEPSLMIHVDDDNEQRKRLFALLLRGVPIICVDNIDRPLDLKQANGEAADGTTSLRAIASKDGDASALCHAAASRSGSACCE